MIVDAHHHFWDPARADYPWLTGNLAPIRRAFGPDDLRPFLAERGVGRTVLIQTRSSLEETREFLATAATTEFVAGVVGWVDLTAPDVAGTLRQLRDTPDGRWLVGVRHQVHDEPDPRWLLRPDVRSGLRAVGEAGLAYDLLVRARELPAALAVARELRDARFVIDHLAKPRIACGHDAAWAELMAPFAELGHVHCKLSGMVTESDWAAWTPADLDPFVRRVVGWFGPDRVMFGSDWPVCRLAASYGQVLDALDPVLAHLPARDRELVLGRSAMRFYRLPLENDDVGGSS